MPKAPRRCPANDCTNLIRHTRYCDQHTREKAFAAPHRRYGDTSRTSTNTWRTIAAAARIRDHNQCVHCGADGTTTRLECDHITNHANGGTDTLTNAQMLCTPCHRTKTQAEANAGRQKATQGQGHHPSPHPTQRATRRPVNSGPYGFGDSGS